MCVLYVCNCCAGSGVGDIYYIFVLGMLVLYAITTVYDVTVGGRETPAILGTGAHLRFALVLTSAPASGGLDGCLGSLKTTAMVGPSRPPFGRKT
jgi:hypothetical protein